MLRWLKSLPLALPLTLVLAGFGFLLSSCTSGNQAQVRFIHAIQDAGPLDIDFNGTKEITDIVFLGLQPSTGYLAVPAGSDTITGFQTGSTSNAVFTNSNVTLNSGSQYTMVATGFTTTTSSVVILNPVDTNTEPPDGTVDFRAINASPSGPNALDIYILANPVTCALGQGSCTATISGLAYQQTSGYVPLNYNSNGSGYTIYVCTSGSTNPIFSQGPINVGSVSEGSIRTFVLTDAQDVDQLNHSLIVLNDLN
jgi:hypothetical protein